MDKFNYFKFTEGDISLDVRVLVEDGTIWLSASEMATLFNVATTTIRRIIKSTYNVDSFGDDTISASNAPFAPMVVQPPKKKPFQVYDQNVVKEVGSKLNNCILEKLKSFINDKLNSRTKSNIIIYNNGDISLDVSVDPALDTVWLSQEQIAVLYNTTQQNVSLHIKNIFKESELEVESVYKDFLYTAKDGKRYLVGYYNLDLILAVGYRIKGAAAIAFRKWATKVLKDYLINGVAIFNKKDDAAIYKSVINLNNEYQEIKNELEQIKSKLFDNEDKERLFFNGEYFDAFFFVSSLLGKAKTSIKIIDPYFDDKGFAFLQKISPSIEKKIYKSHNTKLSQTDIGRYEKQYGKITITNIDTIHDRFIIIDDEICYTLGTSLNTMGRKVFAINKIETKVVIESIIECIN